MSTRAVYTFQDSTGLYHTHWMPLPPAPKVGAKAELRKTSMDGTMVIDEIAAEYYRADWMSDNQWECVLMLADLQKGFHHIGGKIKPCGRGIQCCLSNLRAATYDFDGLTRLVILAHDRCIRAEIEPGGPGRLKVVLHKRQRDGVMHERHPTIQQAIEAVL